MLRNRCAELRGWRRVCTLALFATALAVAAPAAAQEYRSCEARYVIALSDGSGEPAGSDAFQARMGVSVGRPLTNLPGVQETEARRAARRLIEDCVQSHWAAPFSAYAPPICIRNEGPGLGGMFGYPFRKLYDDVTDLICAANPGRRRLTVDIDVVVDGDTGCIPPPNLWAIPITRDYPIHCPVRRTTVPQPQLRRETEEPRTIVPQPDLRRAGTPPLPGVRMPGNDIRRVWIGDDDWRACAGLCVETPSCRAWTWRAPGTSGPGSQAACWLKHTVGGQIADPCCHSGIRE